MTQFNVGETLSNQQPFNLDIESIVAGRTFIASITRWGKSKTVRKMLEACFGHTGIILIDPEGEWSSLREKFPFLIIGKDVPLQLETAQAMAELVLTRGLSVIIDTSMVEDEEESKEYINAFLRRFFFIETTQKQSYLIVVEEAEDFVPERGISTQTCLGIFINIVKKGGKRGIGALFIAHRPAWVSKGILSQCRNKAFSAIESTDFEAIEQVARVPKTVVEKLPSLKPGQFYFVGDWVNQPEFVQVNKQTLTTHLGDSPGLKYVIPNAEGLAEVIKGLQANLKEVVEKVTPKMPDVEEIRKEADIKANEKADERIKKETAKIENQFKDQLTTLEQCKNNLSKKVELLSQAASLSTPAAPINDVLSHPVVINNLAKLSQRDERAKNLLVKIHQDTEAKHYPNKEELAAFLSVSLDTVKRLVDVVNEVFHVTAVLGEGKPMQYRSMLKRLYITDIARREIERIEELEADKRGLEQTVQGLQIEKQNWLAENGRLRSYVAPDVVGTLRSELSDLREKCKQATPEMLESLKSKNAELAENLRNTTKLLSNVNQERKYLARSLKTLRGKADEFNNALNEIETGYQTMISENQEAQPIEAIKTAEAPKGIEVPKTPITQPILASANPAINTPAELYQPTPANPQHQKVLTFLKSHINQEFSGFELSLALGLPEQVICETPHIFEEIKVSPNGLSVKEMRN